MVKMHRKISLDIVRELNAAKEALAQPGARTDKKLYNLLPNGTRLETFETYLDDIGLAKRTAYRYLSDYLPDQDRLMTEDEKEERRGQLLIGLFKVIETHREKGDKDWRPYPWNESLERKYWKWHDSLSVIKAIEDNTLQQAELFSREYLNLLARQLEDDPTPEEMLYEHELIERYRSVVTPAVPARDQISIVRLAERAVSLFAQPARAEVARSVAKVLMDLADTMEG